MPQRGQRQVTTLEQAFDLLRTAGPFTPSLSWRRGLPPGLTSLR